MCPIMKIHLVVDDNDDDYVDVAFLPVVVVVSTAVVDLDKTISALGLHPRIYSLNVSLVG